MTCKICNSKTEIKHVLKDSRVFEHCGFCGFIGQASEFLDPKTEKSRYDFHENSIENEGYVSMFEDFIDFAIKPFNVEKILDYGSGPGPVLAELLKRRGYEVDIYDPFYAPSEPDLQYDLISSTEVFEHFNEPIKSIEKVISFLKPKGYLSVMSHFACKPEEFQSWWYKNDDTHVSFYSLRTYEIIAEEFSLNIIKNNSKNIIVLQKK